jgi:hypothetical protein
MYGTGTVCRCLWHCIMAPAHCIGVWHCIMALAHCAGVRGTKLWHWHIVPVSVALHYGTGTVPGYVTEPLGKGTSVPVSLALHYGTGTLYRCPWHCIMALAHCTGVCGTALWHWHTTCVCCTVLWHWHTLPVSVALH